MICGAGNNSSFYTLELDRNGAFVKLALLLQRKLCGIY